MPDRVERIRSVTYWGMAVNIFLTIVKLIVGIIGASQAVLADAFHSLSDIVTDLSVIVGVKFWSAPPDEEHPYGHSKIESMVTLVIGISLLFVSIGLSYEALRSFNADVKTNVGLTALIGPLLSIFLKEILFRWTFKVGKGINSNAVIANAWHHRTDAISSIPALFAAGIAYFFPSIGYIDYIGAIIVSLFILKVSWDIIKPSLQELTDYGVQKEDIEKITDTAKNIDGVKNVHAVRTRKSGSNIFVDMHVLVNPELTVKAGHDISTEVKNTILENFENIVDVVVHLEPNE